MKYLLILTSAFLFSISNALAVESDVEIIEQFDNIRTVAFVGIKDIENSPVWNPSASGDSTPPLSVNGALQAVSDFAKLQESNTIREIEIRPVPKYENHWHYLIKVASDTSASKNDIYVVLMSGKVLPAIIQPQGYK